MILLLQSPLWLVVSQVYKTTAMEGGFFNFFRWAILISIVIYVKFFFGPFPTPKSKQLWSIDEHQWILSLKCVIQVVLGVLPPLCVILLKWRGLLNFWASFATHVTLLFFGHLKQPDLISSSSWHTWTICGKELIISHDYLNSWLRYSRASLVFSKISHRRIQVLVRRLIDDTVWTFFCRNQKKRWC